MAPPVLKTQFGSDGVGFSLSVEEPGSVLCMTLRGLWTSEVGREYQRQIRSLWTRFTPVFHALADVRVSPIQMPEVATLRSELIREAVSRGLHGVAYVTENTLAKMQMRRMAVEAGCKAVECFADEEQAWAWLKWRLGVQRST